MKRSSDGRGIRREAGPCLACGESAAKPILWGYPSAEDYERLGDSVAWGGCCLPEVPAAYLCAACGHEYGVAREFADDDQDGGV